MNPAPTCVAARLSLGSRALAESLTALASDQAALHSQETPSPGSAQPTLGLAWPGELDREAFMKKLSWDQSVASQPRRTAGHCHSGSPKESQSRPTSYPSPLCVPPSTVVSTWLFHRTRWEMKGLAALGSNPCSRAQGAHCPRQSGVGVNPLWTKLLGEPALPILEVVCFLGRTRSERPETQPSLGQGVSGALAHLPGLGARSEGCQHFLQGHTGAPGSPSQKNRTAKECS